MWKYLELNNCARNRTRRDWAACIVCVCVLYVDVEPASDEWNVLDTKEQFAENVCVFAHFHIIFNILSKQQKKQTERRRKKTTKALKHNCCADVSLIHNTYYNKMREINEEYISGIHSIEEFIIIVKFVYVCGVHPISWILTTP